MIGLVCRDRLEVRLRRASRAGQQTGPVGPGGSCQIHGTRGFGSHGSLGLLGNRGFGSHGSLALEARVPRVSAPTDPGARAKCHATSSRSLSDSSHATSRSSRFICDLMPPLLRQMTSVHAERSTRGLGFLATARLRSTLASRVTKTRFLRVLRVFPRPQDPPQRVPRIPAAPREPRVRVRVRPEPVCWPGSRREPQSRHRVVHSPIDQGG